MNVLRPPTVALLGGVHIYYLGWNRSPTQVGCMRQVLRPGALGRPRGSGWRGRWEGGLGWGVHINPWLILFNVWQNPLQYCKVISLQLIKINEKKKRTVNWTNLPWTHMGTLASFRDTGRSKRPGSLEGRCRRLVPPWPAEVSQPGLHLTHLHCSAWEQLGLLVRLKPL